LSTPLAGLTLRGHWKEPYQPSTALQAIQLTQGKSNMVAKVIAHVTDAHLGQKVLFGEEAALGKIAYGNEPEEHKDNLKLVLEDLTKRGITEIIFGGDIGTTAANKWFFDLIGKYPFKLRMVLGNHDSFSEVCRHYSSDLFDDRSEMFYAYEDGYNKHIYLDSSSNAISNNQLLWLKQELNSEKNVLLFLHHPVLEINTPLDKAGAALREREKLKNALLDSKKEIVIFCGHYHMNDEVVHRNIRQLSTPAVSYQISKTGTAITIDEQIFGYRLITIDNSEIHTDIVLLKKRA
jgi:3',5'-cyclic-AMP phosphodiesterase